MRALILVNGEPPSATYMRGLVAQHDLFIATDGAAHRASGLGLTPDIVCGDFDSIDLDVARTQLPQSEFVATPDQDHADLEKAIHLAMDRGATSVTVAGAAGGRIDHTLGNFTLLLRYHTEICIAVVDDRAEVRAVSGTDRAPGAWSIQTQPGDTISLISMDGEARATLVGVKWPLNDHQLDIGTHGISNVAVSGQVLVQVRGGVLIVCHIGAVDRLTG